MNCNNVNKIEKQNIAEEGSDNQSRMSSNNISVLIPFETIQFLNKERLVNNPNRYSKLNALYDLISKHCDNLGSSTIKRNNISQLCKKWNWARLTVIGFIKALQEMGVKFFKNVIVGKSITINQLKEWLDAKKEEHYEIRRKYTLNNEIFRNKPAILCLKNSYSLNLVPSLR